MLPLLLALLVVQQHPAKNKHAGEKGYVVPPSALVIDSFIVRPANPKYASTVPMKAGDTLTFCVFPKFHTGEVGIGAQDHPNCDAAYAALNLQPWQRNLYKEQDALIDTLCYGPASGGLGSWSLRDACVDSLDPPKVIVPPPVGNLFFDDFEFGTKAQWTKISGTWAIATDATGNHVFKQSTTGSSFVSLTGSWTNYYVQANVTPLSWASSDATVRLSSRMSGPSNFYAASLEQTALRLRKFVNGSITDLAPAKSYVVTAGKTYKVTLVMSGPNLSMYVNDTLRLSATDATFTGGGIALGGWNTTSQWDNVSVVAVP
jgi:hypothetical protein